MAVPKGKVSKQRRNKRRSSRWEAGDSRSGGMPQVWCAASASQNVPGMRYLQWPSGQGDQVRGRWQVSHRRVSLLGGKRFSSLLTFCPFFGLVVCRAGRCPHRPVHAYSVR